MLARYKFQVTPKFFLKIIPLICMASIAIGFGVGMVQSQHQVNQHQILPKEL